MSYNSELQNNNDELQVILDEVNALPPANVSPVVNCKSYDITLTKASGWVELVTLDADVLAHINDQNFTVLLVIKDAYAYEYYVGTTYICSNTPISMQSNYPVYGIANRKTSEANMTTTGIFYPANKTDTSESLGGNGIFRVNGSKYYLKPGDGYIRGGNYRLVFTW